MTTYPRDEIFLELKGDGSLPGARQPGHPNRASAKSPDGTNRLTPFLPGHMMRLRRHVRRYRLALHPKVHFSLSVNLPDARYPLSLRNAVQP